MHQRIWSTPLSIPAGRQAGIKHKSVYGSVFFICLYVWTAETVSQWQSSKKPFTLNLLSLHILPLAFEEETDGRSVATSEVALILMGFTLHNDKCTPTAPFDGEISSLNWALA